MRFKSVSRAVHGGRGSYIQTSEDKIIDFSANLNPYPPDLDLSISPDMAMRYPDDDYQIIKEIISDFHHCSPDCITVGNGSVEVLRTLCHTFLNPGSTVFIPPHTFAEYELSARLAGATLNKTESFSDIIFLCNPDNPTGKLVPRETILNKVHENDGNGLLCVDEAFIDLADPEQSVSDTIHPNLFIMRSLTKSFAMAGVRFGYGIGDPELIAAMEVMRPPWTVNVLAESLVKQAFASYNNLKFSREMIGTERKRIINAVIDHGWKCQEGSANFLFINTGKDASDVTGEFMHHKILVRDCSSFGYPTHIRVAIRTVEENNQLINALKRVN